MSNPYLPPEEPSNGKETGDAYPVSLHTPPNQAQQTPFNPAPQDYPQPTYAPQQGYSQPPQGGYPQQGQYSYYPQSTHTPPPMTPYGQPPRYKSTAFKTGFIIIGVFGGGFLLLIVFANIWYHTQ